MRTVYLGTSEFAAAVLERLADSAHAPALVVTQPDARRGRGRRPGPPPVAETAAALGIPLVQPADVNAAEGLAAIQAAGPDALCLCAYGQIVGEPLLSDHLILNVHPSLLPRWRGAAPIERAILAGDAETGVSIMRLTAGLDSGPVCGQERVRIGPEDDHGALAGRLAEAGAEALLAALDGTQAGVLAWEEQDDAAATYAGKLTGDDRRLRVEGGAADEARRVRALSPHIGAYLSEPGGERLGVLRAAAVGEAEAPAGEPGAVATAGGRLMVRCRDGALELLEVQPPGGRPIPAADYLRGHAPPPAFE